MVMVAIAIQSRKDNNMGKSLKTLQICLEVFQSDFHDSSYLEVQNSLLKFLFSLTSQLIDWNHIKDLFYMILAIYRWQPDQISLELTTVTIEIIDLILHPFLQTPKTLRINTY